MTAVNLVEARDLMMVLLAVAPHLFPRGVFQVLLHFTLPLSVVGKMRRFGDFPL
jgi:hypothetical protein